jgi:hypothetical protein
MIGGVGPRTESGERLPVDHGFQLVVIPDFDLLLLVAGAEAVEEMHDGDSPGDGGKVRHRGQIHDLLRVRGGQHGNAGAPAGHHVALVAEDAERVGGKGPGGDVEDGRGQFSRDLIEVRDHEQEALGSGESGSQGACGDGPVDRAGLGAALDCISTTRTC